MGLVTFAAGQAISSHRRKRAKQEKFNKQLDDKYGDAGAALGMGLLVAPFVLPILFAEAVTKKTPEQEALYRAKVERRKAINARARKSFVRSMLTFIGIVVSFPLAIFVGAIANEMTSNADVVLPASCFTFFIVAGLSLGVANQLAEDDVARQDREAAIAKDEALKAEMAVIVGDDRTLSDESLRQQEYRKIAAQMRKVASA